MRIETERFRQIALEELATRHTRAHLDLVGLIIKERRRATMASFPDPAAAMELGRAIRADTLARLPELLEQFDEKDRANGAVVYWARDANEANAYVLEIARERDIPFVTKGKSMVTEETGLNECLAKSGIQVFETDLGEFIIQLLGRPPFHIQGPAANVPVQEICELFREKGILKEPTLNPVELGQAARAFLRDKFHHAKMGITGVNLAVAETGTIINVENEGNIRLTKSSPRTQVSLMTLEKVVPTMRDAMHLLRLLCRSCTGQKLASYVTLDSGPRREGDRDGPEELFVVIVDNGRSRIYQDPEARQVLTCIRCGACMLACPVYGMIGGYPYGWVYSGPMGQVLDPVMLGLDRTRDLYHACTDCGACKTVCPAGIDHPRMMRSYRIQEVEGDPRYGARRRPWTESRAMGVFAWAAAKRWRWDLGVRGIRALISRRGRKTVVRRWGGPLKAWVEARDLPAMPAKTFHDRIRARNKVGESQGPEG